MIRRGSRSCAAKPGSSVERTSLPRNRETSAGSGLGTFIWEKLAAGFEVGEVMAVAGSGLNDHDIQALATGMVHRDPEAAVEWLMKNGERDPNHTIFHAVVREWVAVDSTRASEQLGKITSPAHLQMFARELARAAEAEGNDAAAAAWLRIASP